MKQFLILMMVAVLFAACVSQNASKRSNDYKMIQKNLRNDSTQILLMRRELPVTPDYTRWVRVGSDGIQTQYNLTRFDPKTGSTHTTPFVCWLISQ